MEELQAVIEQAFETPDKISPEAEKAVLRAIGEMDAGRLRVCEKVTDAKKNAVWRTHQWLKKAVLLYFRIQKMVLYQAGDFNYFDKIPVKKWTGKEGVRVIPHALARYGSFVEPGAILMPSYVNIGAYVGSGTMIDTWATVGSCAQVGKNVHVSGGVGIGGVIEPVQANPVVIEDHAFIGSRCILVEGVLIEEGAVLAAGVTITASTKILDVTGPKAVELKGRVPKNSVVIPGSTEKSFPAGRFGVPCALIIGTRSESTDRKTSLTQIIRDFEISV